jgi:hypothetical protein
MQNFDEIEAIASYDCGIVMLIYDVRPTFPLAQGIREDE